MNTRNLWRAGSTLLLALVSLGATSLGAAPFNIRTVAGTGNDSFNGDNQAATTANVSRPIGVYRSSSGDLYIAEFYASRVRRNLQHRGRGSGSSTSRFRDRGSEEEQAEEEDRQEREADHEMAHQQDHSAPHHDFPGGSGGFGYRHPPSETPWMTPGCVSQTPSRHNRTKRKGVRG